MYTVTIGTGLAWTYTEAVKAENEVEAVDMVIDAMEERGDTGFLLSMEECETTPDDEYIVGGNHCLGLYHHGTLIVRKVDN